MPGKGDGMRVLNWNIRWGGKGKESEIVEKLCEYSADLLVLTEYKNNESGERISSELHSIGYVHAVCSSGNPNRNGVAAFSKAPIRLHPDRFTDRENVCMFDWTGITFIGVFCANDEITARFVEEFVAMKPGNRTVLIGDLNTGPRGSMPDRYEALDRIVESGFVDLWRNSGKDICWSYQSGRGKSQPDHALCSDDLQDLNWDVEYDLSTIDRDISDHALMKVDFDNPISRTDRSG